MVGAQDACNNLIVEGVLGQSGSKNRHRREEGIPFPPFTQVSESSQTCLSLSLSPCPPPVWLPNQAQEGVRTILRTLGIP